MSKITLNRFPSSLGSPFVNTNNSRLPEWFDLGPPSIHRPFGIRLWPIFETILASVASYGSGGFRLDIGETPFTSLKDVVNILASYYVVVLCGPILLRNSKPFKMQLLFRSYNLLLVILSGVLCLLFLEQIIPTISRRGLLYAICELNGGFTDELRLLYYVGSVIMHWRLWTDRLADQLSNEVSRTL
jgi:fatty acid elongase 3